MGQPTLDDVVKLAGELESMTDSRPHWLRELRDAEHPTCPYYRFLHELAGRFSPLEVVEVGTFVGTSAAHLAAANTGSVFTIDIQPDAKRQADAIGCKNLFAITGDSLKVVQMLCDRQYDIAYIDGLHNFNQTYGEYMTYRQIVRDGGLLIFDDVALEMDGDEMEVFWSFVPEPKVRLDHLHTTGFGVVRKDDSVRVPGWDEIIEQASNTIRQNRRGV